MKFEIGKTQVEVVSSRDLVRRWDGSKYVGLDLTGEKGPVVGTIPPPPKNPSPDFEPNRVKVRLDNLGEKLGRATGGDIINFRPEDIKPITK